MGYNPSYAWRSIMGAREVVERGARWQIGNGEKVNILKDRWIPGNNGFKLLYGANNLKENARVCDLIDRDLGGWKKEVIREKFSQEEAKMIVSIPLSRIPTDDKIIWHFEKNGEYSFKTAYHATCAQKECLLPGPSSHSNQNLWQLIWRAPILNRQRNFLWCVAKNILPTRGNLLKKGISLDPVCPFCSAEIETMQHLLMDCVFAKQVLFASPLSYRIPANVGVNQWLQTVLSCCDDGYVQFICFCLYKIWDTRNLGVFQNKRCCPIAVASGAVECVQEFRRANPVNGKKASVTVRRLGETFPLDVHIAQVDAGITWNGEAVFGCLFKSHSLVFLLAASKKESIEVEASLAEMMAIRWCIQLAVELKLDKVVFQSDAQVVVDCINSIISIAVLEPLAAECRSLLSGVTFGSVIFIPRSCNSEAHNIVSLGKLYGSRTWLCNPPVIDSVVSGELPPLS
ncbi:uncharacterized protein LOC131661587 [Vicia villosa]|uniref:uncharacterized protein LOC131661587 n=1 Tax=Vicia villosa TaxID=3911 RepID=UPI00273C2446|nr:uncharacterized protein LOC131661587 [Vicia villosa]